MPTTGRRGFGASDPRPAGGLNLRWWLLAWAHGGAFGRELVWHFRRWWWSVGAPLSSPERGAEHRGQGRRLHESGAVCRLTPGGRLPPVLEGLECKNRTSRLPGDKRHRPKGPVGGAAALGRQEGDHHPREMLEESLSLAGSLSS